MSTDAGDASTVPVGEAASLLGITPDAVRKRFAAGRLKGASGVGGVRVSRAAVEAERRELLRRLDARDARPGHSDDVVAAELHVLRTECERLRADLVSVRAAAQSLAQGSASALDSARAHLDAVQQFLLPSSVDG